LSGGGDELLFGVPPQRRRLLVVLPVEDVPNAVLDLEDGVAVVGVDEEGTHAVVLEEEVCLGGRHATRDHNVGEGEEGGFGVAVGAVNEDATGEMVATSEGRRRGLIADPAGVVDDLVDEGGLSASGVAKSGRGRERLEVDHVVDVRAEDCRLSLDVAVVLGSEETADLVVSLTLRLELVERCVSASEGGGVLERRTVVRLDANGEGEGVAIVEKGGGRVGRERAGVGLRHRDVLGVAELCIVEASAKRARKKRTKEEERTQTFSPISLAWVRTLISSRSRSKKLRRLRENPCESMATS
jgi:hypothetical protein